MNLFNSLSGYKSLIGALILVVSPQLSQFGVDTTQLGILIHQLVTAFGAILTIIGLIHKIYKTVQGKKITAKMIEEAAVAMFRASMAAKIAEAQPPTAAQPAAPTVPPQEPGA